jgi:hypothetical protein
MIKAIVSLPLVIPLVAFMSAPAVANNQMCCVAAIPPQANAPPKTMAATRLGFDVFCDSPPLRREWKPAYCRDPARDPRDFCVEPLKTAPKAELIYTYTLSPDKTHCDRDDGKPGIISDTPVCDPTKVTPCP